MFCYMPTYERFEDLPVWQEAALLYNRGLDLIQSPALPLGAAWKFQFERAALSVSNNIAEGFERLSPGELKNFLLFSRGSAGEVRSMTAIISGRPELKSHLAALKEIRDLADTCGRQLGAWIQSIKSQRTRRGSTT
jgi:four helix bundle protein